MALRPRGLLLGWWPRDAHTERPAPAPVQPVAMRQATAPQEPTPLLPAQDPTLPLYHDANLW